ncbi:hypothetical protein LCGC14_0700260 [marine sediment metagenome]|uniref:Uncharacterized protein n=1 Tax=marine sediment metagenome TaxID=412755 RepID=A0A0F9QMP7_9ZZZZ
MQKIQLVKLLPLLLMLSVFAVSSHAATGNVDSLCSEISDDLSAAGGCVDDDDLEDTITSTGALVVLETGDSASLLTLAGVLVIGAIAFAIVIESTTGAISGTMKKFKR